MLDVMLYLAFFPLMASINILAQKNAAQWIFSFLTILCNPRDDSVLKSQ